MRGLQRFGNVFRLRKFGVNKACSIINRRYLNNHVKRVLQAQELNAALLRKFNSNQISQSRTFGNLIKFLQESGKNPQNSFAGNSNLMYAIVPINNLPKIYLVPMETDASLNGQPILPVLMSNGSLAFHYVVFDPKSQSNVDNNQSNTNEFEVESVGFSDAKELHNEKSLARKDSLNDLSLQSREKVTTDLGHLANNLAILGKLNESNQMDSKFSSLAVRDSSSQISANITDFHIKLKLRIPKDQLSKINNSHEKPNEANGKCNQNESKEITKKSDSSKLSYVAPDLSSQVDTIQASVDTIPLGFKIRFSSIAGILNSNELANIGNGNNFGGTINKLLGRTSANLNHCAFYSKKSKSKRGNQWDARVQKLCEGDKIETESKQPKEGEKKCLDDNLNEPFTLDLLPCKSLPFSCNPKQEKKNKYEKNTETKESQKVNSESLAEETLPKMQENKNTPKAIKDEMKSSSDCNTPRLCPERVEKHVLKNTQDKSKSNVNTTKAANRGPDFVEIDVTMWNSELLCCSQDKNMDKKNSSKKPESLGEFCSETKGTSKNNLTDDIKKSMGGSADCSELRKLSKKSSEFAGTTNCESLKESIKKSKLKDLEAGSTNNSSPKNEKLFDCQNLNSTESQNKSNSGSSNKKPGEKSICGSTDKSKAGGNAQKPSVSICGSQNAKDNASSPNKKPEEKSICGSTDKSKAADNAQKPSRSICGSQNAKDNASSPTKKPEEKSICGSTDKSKAGGNAQKPSVSICGSQNAKDNASSPNKKPEEKSICGSTDKSKAGDNAQKPSVSICGSQNAKDNASSPNKKPEEKSICGSTDKSKAGCNAQKPSVSICGSQNAKDNASSPNKKSEEKSICGSTDKSKAADNAQKPSVSICGSQNAKDNASSPNKKPEEKSICGSTDKSKAGDNAQKPSVSICGSQNAKDNASSSNKKPEEKSICGSTDKSKAADNAQKPSVSICGSQNAKDNASSPNKKPEEKSICGSTDKSKAADNAQKPSVSICGSQNAKDNASSPNKKPEEKSICGSTDKSKAGDNAQKPSVSACGSQNANDKSNSSSPCQNVIPNAELQNIDDSSSNKKPEEKSVCGSPNNAKTDAKPSVSSCGSQKVQGNISSPSKKPEKKITCSFLDNTEINTFTCGPVNPNEYQSISSEYKDKDACSTTSMKSDERKVCGLPFSNPETNSNLLIPSVSNPNKQFDSVSPSNDLVKAKTADILAINTIHTSNKTDTNLDKNTEKLCCEFIIYLRKKAQETIKNESQLNVQQDPYSSKTNPSNGGSRFYSTNARRSFEFESKLISEKVFKTSDQDRRYVNNQVTQNKFLKSIQNNTETKICESAKSDDENEINSLIAILKPKTLCIEKVPVRRIANDQVLIKMDTIGICGSDVHIYDKGINSRNSLNSSILCQEGSGYVTKIGKSVQNLKVGDRVAVEPGIACNNCTSCMSGMKNLCSEMKFVGLLSKFHIHPADLCHKLPSKVNMEQGALLHPLSQALNACRMANINIGANVLIIGACPLGLLSIICAKAMGANNITVIDNSYQSLNTACEFSANQIVFITDKMPIKDVTETVLSEVDCHPNVVIDCCGCSKSINMGILSLQSGGVHVLLGCQAECADIPILAAMTKGITIKTSSHPCSNIYPMAINLIRNGRSPIEKLVTHRFRINHVPGAFEVALNDVQAKVSIKWDKDIVDKPKLS